MNVAERVTHSSGPTRYVARCLGRFRLDEANGNQLQIRTRKARALLAATAVSGRPMSRDALADLLWSDRGEAQARASLRQTIFELQHFAGEDAPILVAGRDDVAIRPEHLVTDIDLIRTAGTTGDWPRLLALLEGCEPGLLTDLDGLDAEFDDWLRVERAKEPARTLTTAADAAERCLSEAGPRAALDLVSEILRLDPMNEEATRLALRIDHELGDSRALRHHFASLTERLRDDYDAEPSAETISLFETLSNGALPRPGTKEASTPSSEPQSIPARKDWRHLAIAALLAVIVAGAIIFMFARRDPPAASDSPTILAVLPFEQHGSADPWLAQGLWDDTRNALSRNGRLRLMGRTTVEAMAARNATADQYRRQLKVDYLLEGSVQRASNRVRVMVSLTRTSDGVTIWEDAFQGKLGDPLALQDAIANAIEGRLRGRLARGGGRRAEQIGTTPEVYSLYSEARSLIYERRTGGSKRAQVLLRDAVRLDPNYAPAWAALAETTHFVDYGPGGSSARRAAGLSYARRALALAPELARAHGIYGFLLGAGSASGQRELRTAVALDPSYVEAWSWLGNALAYTDGARNAAEAYRHAVDLDPAWPPAVSNLADKYRELGDRKAVEGLVVAMQRAGGDPDVIVALRIRDAAIRGDLSAAIKPLYGLKRGDFYADWEGGQTLIKLGYLDEGLRMTHCPPQFAAVIRSAQLPAADFAGVPVAARDFWLRDDFSPAAARAFVNLGRERDLLTRYRDAFPSNAQAILEMSDSGLLPALGPTLAVALQRSGHGEDADQLLHATERHLEPAMRTKQLYFGAPWQLAQVRAAQGSRDEAFDLMERSLASGWLPDGIVDATDIAKEPAFHNLLGDPRFAAIRKRILDHMAKERAELGPLKL